MNQLALINHDVDSAWCAYFAGLLDGEGWIGIGNNTPAVKVEMCHQDVVAEIHARYGGVFASYEGRTRSHSRTYVWRAGGVRCIRPLCDALPFLRVKAEQANIVLDFARGIAPAGTRLPAVERLRRARAKAECSDLNRRGGDPPA